MKNRAAFASCFTLILFTALPAAHAEKKVKFNLQNNTGAPLELKLGDKMATLKEDEILAVKLPVGTRIITNTATQHHPAGSVVTVVSGFLTSNSTVSIGK